MTAKSIFEALFRKRPDAPAWCYIPFFLVAVLFAVLGADDTGNWSLLTYGILAVLCTLQMWGRTIVGWGVLFAISATYAVAVLTSPENGNAQDYIFFSACGTLPTVLLWVGRPWRNISKASADVPMSLPPTA